MEGEGSEGEEALGETVCFCGNVYEDGVFMIQCDICRDWLHGDCVRLDELQAHDVDKYHCPKCTPLCGPSIMKTETNWHRHDRTDPHATYKPLQVGTMMFLEELSKRFFSSSDDITMKVSGKQLTLPYLNQTGFNQPILVTDKEGLGITVPPPGYGVHDVSQAMGQDHLLDIIDGLRQKTCQMTIDQFSQNFTDPESDRVLNCLSLEITDSAISEVGLEVRELRSDICHSDLDSTPRGEKTVLGQQRVAKLQYSPAQETSGESLADKLVVVGVT